MVKCRDQEITIGYTKYYSVTEMLLALGLPSFDTVIHNYRNSFLCVWSNHSNDMVKLLRCVSPSAFLLCFIVHLVLLFSFVLLILSTICLSVCLYVSCLCLWALLPDFNKMMMIISKHGRPQDFFQGWAMRGSEGRRSPIGV